MSKRPRMNHATGVQGEGRGGGHERGPDHRGVIPAVPGSSEPDYGMKKAFTGTCGGCF